MKTAILSLGGVEGVRVAAVEASINETPEQRKIPGINKLINFEFKNDGVFAIGKGRKINKEYGQGGSFKALYIKIYMYFLSSINDYIYNSAALHQSTCTCKGNIERLKGYEPFALSKVPFTS